MQLASQPWLIFFVDLVKTQDATGGPPYTGVRRADLGRILPSTRAKIDGLNVDELLKFVLSDSNFLP